LKAVFKIIIPSNFMTHAKFAISDTPEMKNERMIEEFESIVKEDELEQAA